MFHRHKFNAKPVTDDGIHFSSKKEHAYYRQLLLAKSSGDLLFFLRQTPLHLPGNIKYVVDFVEFWKSGEVRFVDVKGFDTPLSKTKRSIAEATYPLTILIT